MAALLKNPNPERIFMVANFATPDRADALRAELEQKGVQKLIIHQNSEESAIMHSVRKGSPAFKGTPSVIIVVDPLSAGPERALAVRIAKESARADRNYVMLIGDRSAAEQEDLKRNNVAYIPATLMDNVSRTSDEIIKILNNRLRALPNR